MEEHSTLPPAMQDIVSRVLAPEAPLPLKLSAARGLLPLPQGLVLRILVALQMDGESAVTEVASRSLEEYTRDPSRLSGFLGEGSIDPSVLSHFGRRMAKNGNAGVLRVIVAHPNTPAETLEILASSQKGEVLESIFLNEARLSRAAGILDALKENPHLSSRQRTRIEEIEMHLLHRQVAAPARVPEAVPREPAAVAESPATGADSVEPETLPQDLTAEPLEEEQPEEELPRTAIEKIQNLTVPEKVQLALSADREERMILVRDSNKLVASAVVKSPKVTQKDAEAFAGLRNVDEEVLRLIGSRREWTKNYNVVHALVHNPRTPTGLAMTLLGRVHTRDLKMLSGNRNIPEVIRRTAMKIWQGRVQATRVSLRKK